MPRALVFINTFPEANNIVEDLTKLEGISEAHASRGMYEAVALVQAESYNQVKEIVSQRIRNIANVKATLTLTLIEKPLKP